MTDFEEGWYTCRTHGQQDRYVLDHDQFRVKYAVPQKNRPELKMWRYVKKAHFDAYYVRNRDHVSEQL